MAHATFPHDPRTLAETLARRLRTAADHGRDEVERVVHRSARTLRKASRRRLRHLGHGAGATIRAAGERARTRPVMLGAAVAGLAALAGLVLLRRRPER